jgi:hypothetical protein
VVDGSGGDVPPVHPTGEEEEYDNELIQSAED